VRPTYFKNGVEFRRWLAKHHDSTPELLVGFYKKESGKGGITYPQALDEALCYGWIDGIRKRFDAYSYTVRFSPRTKRSVWSKVNIKRAGELKQEGRMAAPGLRAFEGRDVTRANQYSFERENCELDAALQRQFKRDREAWSFFASQPPGYRRIATWYVMSAKKEETRQRRLDYLMTQCRAGKRIGIEPTGTKPRSKQEANGRSR
jgi:uncharacterized protein YdeI (YjbR/CyaY-like superfamily)